MLQVQWKGYNGVQEEGFTGYQASDSVFCYIEIFDQAVSREDGKKILDSIVSALEQSRPGSLASFEESVNASLQKGNLPLDFSLALGYRVETVLYLKTVGSGSIFLKRGGHYATVIQGNNVASGFLHEGDAFAFTTDYFLKQLKGEEHLKHILHAKHQIQEMEERMKGYYMGQTEGGGLLLAVFSEPQTAVESAPAYAMPQPGEDMTPPARRNPSPAFRMPDMKGYAGKLDRKKIIVGAIVIFVLAALLLNIGRLSGNKQKAVQQSKLATLQSQVQNEITSWSEDSGDMQQALGHISEYKLSLSDLKKTDKSASSSDIAALEKDLNAFEAKVLKREVAKAAEFADLSVEEKGAEGSRMVLDGGDVSILNRQGRVYVLSLENKSLKKKVFSEIANADLIGSYDGNIYLFRQGTGIYKIDTKDTVKKIITKDDQWSNVTDMTVYNGNIYLLDPGAKNIYKYLVATDGYSDTIPYFKTGIPSLSQAKSFSINVAIYINLGDSLLKYLSGDQQDFKPQFPEQDIALSSIFTSKESDNLYGLDKAKGVVYVWGKDGAYLKQVQSDAFAKCDDFVVYKDAAYILKGSKILKVGLSAQ